MTKLFIGGFPLEMDELALVQVVAPFADVVTVKLVRDKTPRICKAYGFMEVTDETNAYNAMDNLNGTLIGNRELILNIVKEEAPKPVPIFRKVERRGIDERPKRPRRPRL